MPTGSDYMIALVESFVLKSIGHLSAEREAQIAKLQPWLNVTFRNVGSWDQCLAATLHFPDSIEKSFRDIFDQYLNHCATTGDNPDPEEFAQQVVDKNFAPHIRATISG